MVSRRNCQESLIPGSKINCLRFVIIGPDKFSIGPESFRAHARTRNPIVHSIVHGQDTFIGQDNVVLNAEIINYVNDSYISRNFY